MKTKLNYPNIADQPEYKAAYEKLSQFTAKHAEAQQLLDQYNAERARRINAIPEDVIGVADALLAGRKHDTYIQQITDAALAVSAFSKAIYAQRLVLDNVIRILSATAAKQFMPQHKAIVKKMADAIHVLHAANTEEVVMRAELTRLGYTGWTLPCMEYNAGIDPNDITGSAAYYWMRDSMPYIQA